MAVSSIRNTGTHFRYDGDDELWHVKVRTVNLAGGKTDFEEFVTQLATFAEVILWLNALFGSLASRPDTSVLGY